MDPHTSIAKAVADRFKQDRPMVIASTAHPGKFAQDVLKIIGNTTNKMATAEMLRALESICPRPGEHKSLLKTLEKDCVGEKSVCDANYQSIASQVENIARNI
jgi:threonine synthase